MQISELDRINQLAHKAKNEGLTADEIAERAMLRQRYLAKIRGQLTNILATVTVVDSEGNDITPQKLRLAQRNGMMI